MLKVVTGVQEGKEPEGLRQYREHYNQCEAKVIEKGKSPTLKKYKT